MPPSFEILGSIVSVKCRYGNLGLNLAVMAMQSREIAGFTTEFRINHWS
ncbi:hypothetical protein SAMN04488515_3160 [Cognatiyoonia koreensis]|uniref:Uncharacterized protein n=1 Tax=Cognatiyoonia koreensis TaxID=364200 RepID=A0A1I0RS46_9RHOB|nr:hypothetical protein SAMN04488515_3160 [Cognatiyoonia koreensis]